MQKIKEPIPVTNFRQNLNKYFSESWSEPVLVNSARVGSRVLLDLKKYNELLEIYEDYLDSKFLMDRVENDSWEYFSIDSLWK